LAFSSRRPPTAPSRRASCWLLYPSIILDQAQKRYSDLIDVVATGSPQDESVQCADLWPIPRRYRFHTRRRPAGPWLQRCLLVVSLGQYFLGRLAAASPSCGGQDAPGPHSQDGCVTLY